MSNCRNAAATGKAAVSCTTRGGGRLGFFISSSSRFRCRTQCGAFAGARLLIQIKSCIATLDAVHADSLGNLPGKSSLTRVSEWCQ